MKTRAPLQGDAAAGFLGMGLLSEFMGPLSDYMTIQVSAVVVCSSMPPSYVAATAFSHPLSGVIPRAAAAPTPPPPPPPLPPLRTLTRHRLCLTSEGRHLLVCSSIPLRCPIKIHCMHALDGNLCIHLQILLSREGEGKESIVRFRSCPDIVTSLLSQAVERFWHGTLPPSAGRRPSGLPVRAPPPYQPAPVF